MSILTHILQARKPNLNVVFGAACVYILSRYTFADISMLMDFVRPDSSGDATIAAGAWAPRFYAMEGLFGQFFQSVIIVRLIGLKIEHRVRRHES